MGFVAWSSGEEGPYWSEGEGELKVAGGGQSDA